MNEEENNKPSELSELSEVSEVSEVPIIKRGRGRLPGYKRTQESIDKQKETRRSHKVIKESIEEPQNELENL